jgi:hypothetical protein
MKSAGDAIVCHLTAHSHIQIDTRICEGYSERTPVSCQQNKQWGKMIIYKDTYILSSLRAILVVTAEIEALALIQVFISICLCERNLQAPKSATLRHLPSAPHCL